MPWIQVQGLAPNSFLCGHCGHKVGAHQGYGHASGTPSGAIYICPHCDRPTYFDNPRSRRTPGAPYGNHVEHVPADISSLYDEARDCYSISAYTGAVLLCRKLLMNIAVKVGANPGEKFIAYVEYLAANGYVPPNGKAWVDHIRKKGNEATHEILLMGESDAKDLISFSEMLLKFMFEFPSRVPQQQQP